MGKQWKHRQTLFSWAPKSLQMVTAAMKLKNTCSLEEKLDKPRQCIKKQRCHLTDKGPYRQSYDFSSSHVWMWRLVHKEGWAPKNWCLQIVVLEKTLETPLNCKDIKPVHPKENQSWIFIERTGTEAETPYFGHLMRRTDSFEKTLMLGKKEGREKRGWMTEDEMVGHPPTWWTWVWLSSWSC